MAFTEVEKITIRRFMGYPAFGNAGSQHLAHRFMTSYGSLEYRMNNLSAGEEEVAREFIARCTQLETDVYGVRDSVDTASAAVWTRNPSEMGERGALLRIWCMKLCDFFGIPPGPQLGSGRRGELIV